LQIRARFVLRRIQRRDHSRTAHGDDSHELRSATAKAPTRANPSWLQKDRSAAPDAVPQM
jgi:hypothetical protein